MVTIKKYLAKFEDMIYNIGRHLGLFGLGKVLFGHGSNYYNSDEKKIDEIIASYASLSVTRPDLVNLLRQDKLQLVSTLDSIIDLMNEIMVKR